MNAKALQFEVEGVEYTLIRLSDGQYYDLQRRSLAIAEDHGFYLSLYFANQQRGELLDFARAYASLKSLFGESGKYYDDFKGSFSFPFLLHVRKPAGGSFYLLNVLNLRSTLEFSLHKLLRPEAQGFDTQRLYQPFAEEFSRAEINQFIAFFYGYLRGYAKTLKRHWTEPFVQMTSSELLLFGYLNGEFFEFACESGDQFNQRRTSLLAQLAEEQAAHPAAPLLEESLLAAARASLEREADA